MDRESGPSADACGRCDGSMTPRAGRLSGRPPALRDPDIRQTPEPRFGRAFGRTWDVATVTLPDGSVVRGMRDMSWGRTVVFFLDNRWWSAKATGHEGHEADLVFDHPKVELRYTVVRVRGPPGSEVEEEGKVNFDVRTELSTADLELAKREATYRAAIDRYTIPLRFFVKDGDTVLEVLPAANYQAALEEESAH